MMGVGDQDEGLRLPRSILRVVARLPPNFFERPSITSYRSLLTKVGGAEQSCELVHVRVCVAYFFRRARRAPKRGRA